MKLDDFLETALAILGFVVAIAALVLLINKLGFFNTTPYVDNCITIERWPNGVDIVDCSPPKWGCDGRPERRRIHPIGVYRLH